MHVLSFPSRCHDHLLHESAQIRSLSICNGLVGGSKRDALGDQPETGQRTPAGIVIEDQLGGIHRPVTIVRAEQPGVAPIRAAGQHRQRERPGDVDAWDRQPIDVRFQLPGLS